MSTTPPSMGDLVNKTGRYSYGTFSGPLYTGAKTALKFYQHLGVKSVETRVKYLSAVVYFHLLCINQNTIKSLAESNSKTKSSIKKLPSFTPSLEDWLRFHTGAGVIPIVPLFKKVILGLMENSLRTLFQSGDKGLSNWK